MTFLLYLSSSSFVYRPFVLRRSETGLVEIWKQNLRKGGGEEQVEAEKTRRTKEETKED